MNALSDQALLRDYAEHRSEPAFAELVRRHIDMVHSAAIRMVRDSHAAQDVTQAVFVALAQSAGRLTDRPVISGWLHRTSRNLASKAVRADVRRHAREQEAAAMNDLLTAESDVNWESIAPHLDAALADLEDADRDAVMLRYFEARSAHQIGEILGVSDDAAQKRVNRAVERLRGLFAKRGVTVGATGLAAAISANAVHAAPAGLTVTVSTAAVLAGTALSTSTVVTATHAVVMTTIQKAVIVTAVAATVGTGIYGARQISRLHEENAQLVARQQQLAGERDTAVSDLAAKTDELDRLRSDSGELLRLRAEVSALRTATKEVQKLRGENEGLRRAQAQAKAPAQVDDQETNPDQLVKIAKLTDAKMLALSLFMYASEHQDQYPTDFNQSTNYLAGRPEGLTQTNQFELVVHGSLKGVKDPMTTIAVRELQRTWLNGQWVKVYAFADGHAQVMAEPPEGFDAWEQQHMMPPANQ